MRGMGLRGWCNITPGACAGGRFLKNGETVKKKAHSRSKHKVKAYKYDIGGWWGWGSSSSTGMEHACPAPRPSPPHSRRPPGRGGQKGGAPGGGRHTPDGRPTGSRRGGPTRRRRGCIGAPTDYSPLTPAASGRWGSSRALAPTPTPSWGGGAPAHSGPPRLSDPHTLLPRRRGGAPRRQRPAAAAADKRQAQAAAPPLNPPPPLLPARSRQRPPPASGDAPPLASGDAHPLPRKRAVAELTLPTAQQKKCRGAAPLICLQVRARLPLLYPSSSPTLTPSTPSPPPTGTRARRRQLGSGR